jgi:hypothetical protein
MDWLSLRQIAHNLRLIREVTTFGFVYKSRTQFKICFDHKFLPINYELYTIKIIPLEIFLIYESTYIFFYDIYLISCQQILVVKAYLKMSQCLVNKMGGSTFFSWME